MTAAFADCAGHRPPGRGALWAAIRAALADAWTRAERSHHRRLGFALLSPEILRDIRLPAEEATGLPSRQADLPFFMQTGFGRR
jgi:hypothetical protein